MIKPEKPTGHLGKRTGLKYLVYLVYFVYWSVEASPTGKSALRVISCWATTQKEESGLPWCTETLGQDKSIYPSQF